MIRKTIDDLLCNALANPKVRKKMVAKLKLRAEKYAPLIQKRNVILDAFKTLKRVKK